MQPDLFNNRLANWVRIVATAGSLCVAGCGHPKFDLLAEVNKRFPVQTEKIEVQRVSIKSDSTATGAASIAAGETAVVSKGAEITILAEVSEREWGLSNALQVWDEPLPIVNLPQQPSALGNTEPKQSHPALNFGVFLRGTGDAKVLIGEKMQIGLFRVVPVPDSPANRRGLIKVTMAAPKSPGIYVLDFFIVNGSATKEEAPRIGFIPFHRILMEVR